MHLRARAPAKINLGLEVLGRRPDGFHDVVTIMLAIDLCDEFVWEATGQPFHYAGADGVPLPRDLVARALEMGPASEWTGSLRVTKRIPTSAGLGGGSSDAALALRLVFPDAPAAQLASIAGTLGSDVPFFLHCGAALARGTGTALTPLRSPDLWLVLVTPPLHLPDKTRRLYDGLTPTDYGDGTHVEQLALHMESAIATPPPNAFERQLRACAEVERAWTALADITDGRVSLSGAGPTLYALFRDEHSARRTATALSPGRDVVRVARTLAADFEHRAIGALAAALRGAATPL